MADVFEMGFLSCARSGKTPREIRVAFAFSQLNQQIPAFYICELS
jgi:hypothetical protein